MSNDLLLIRSAKTILLTTYKRDGTPVRMPASIVFARDPAFFRSYDKAWKTTRLRNNLRVEVAASTLRGKPLGAPVTGLRLCRGSCSAFTNVLSCRESVGVSGR